jgi:hypothetical protein
MLAGTPITAVQRSCDLLHRGCGPTQPCSVCFRQRFMSMHLFNRQRHLFSVFYSSETRRCSSRGIRSALKKIIIGSSSNFFLPRTPLNHGLQARGRLYRS